MKFDFTYDHETTKLAGGKVFLKLWVDSLTPPDDNDSIGLDANVFLLRNHVSMFDDKANPEFETLCNPCNLSEYPLLPVPPDAMYRDRKASILFNSEKEANAFLSQLATKARKLKANVNHMIDTLYVSIDNDKYSVSVSKSDIPFVMVKCEAKEDAPFLIDKAGHRFMGVVSDDDKGKALYKVPSVTLFMYRAFLDKFVGYIKQDLDDYYSL